MSQLSMPRPDPAIVSRRAEIVRQLKKLVPDVVLIADQEGRRTFETDALTAYRCLPLLVALPGTTEEVSKILRFCHDNHIKVVPRGAGTSLSGGALPLEDSIVLWISQKDFIRLARAFPFMETYFKDYIESTFGGPDKGFAPGSAEAIEELENVI